MVMSRIAVFGATGLPGGLVVKHALDQEHEVVALSSPCVIGMLTVSVRAKSLYFRFL